MIGFIENYSLVINVSSLVVLTLVLVLNIIKSRTFPIAQACLYGVAFLVTAVETIGKVFNIASINDFVVLDIGHMESERGSLSRLKELLLDGSDVEVEIANEKGVGIYI